MRCRACGLENDDGRPFCAACGEELVYGAAAELAPPRKAQRNLRRYRRARQAAAAGWQAAADAVDRSAPARSEVALAFRRSFFITLALLPGLAHLFLGRRRAGIYLLFGFLASLLLWLALMGNVLGNIGAFIALGLIGFSVLEVLGTDLYTGQRIQPSLAHFFLAAAVVLGLWAGLMWGANLLWTRITLVQPVMQVAPGGEMPEVVFARGDRLLFSRRAYRDRAPERGDIVLARINRYLYVQRILAVPGDKLVYENGLLYLNDQPLPAAVYPLQPRVLVEMHQGTIEKRDWAARIPWGQYAVWGVADAMGNYDPAITPQIVTRRDIRGKGWLVYSPFSHRRRIEHWRPESAPE